MTKAEIIMAKIANLAKDQQIADNMNNKKGVMGTLGHYANFGQHMTSEKLHKNREMSAL
jgi:hypothetical protein